MANTYWRIAAEGLRKYLIIIATIVTLISYSKAYAIVSFDPVNKTCMISGEISPTDVNQVRKVLQSIGAEPTFYGESAIQVWAE